MAATAPAASRATRKPGPARSRPPRRLPQATQDRRAGRRASRRPHRARRNTRSRPSPRRAHRARTRQARPAHPRPRRPAPRRPPAFAEPALSRGDRSARCQRQRQQRAQPRRHGPGERRGIRPRQRRHQRSRRQHLAPGRYLAARPVKRLGWSCSGLSCTHAAISPGATANLSFKVLVVTLSGCGNSVLATATSGSLSASGSSPAVPCSAPLLSATNLLQQFLKP